MLEELKDCANETRTANGAATLRTSGSDCLDFFATAGALRQADEAEIHARFQRAWAESPDRALRILFYARDVRGGLGERRLFRQILPWLAQRHPDSVRRNLAFVPEYGRWDDLLVLLDGPCGEAVLGQIRAQLERDLEALEQDRPLSLLAKWLPSVNASNPDAVRHGKCLARALGLREARYRKTLTALRARLSLLENRLRERDYSFDYARQPSKALFRYRAAFLRNDAARYQDYLNAVREGRAEMHTGTLTPYDILAPFFLRDPPSPEQCAAIETTWNAQQDFTRGENALVVVDGSGSMYGFRQPCPAAVALSLALYFAERCKGAFHNHFITFSHTPRLVEIKGENLADRLAYCEGFDEVADTNVQKVFELILNAALRRQLPQEELPATLYFISDMEFNACTEDADLSNFEYAKQLYARHGYCLPRVVFWNVNSWNEQQPVCQNEQGVALVSGCSAQLFSLLSSGNFTPYGFMLETLAKYDRIRA